MSSLAVSLVRGPLIGVCLGSCLYGITCLQALFYFQTYADDRRSLKLMVALLLTLETVHVALSMWLLDYYLIANYANELALQSATWFTTVTYSVGFIIDLVVYSYFTWRIWNFTAKLWIVFFMTLIVLARAASGIAASILSVLSSTWVTYLECDRGLILTGNALFVTGDIFSASTMAWYLNKSRNDTPRLHRINLLVSRFIVFFVATGGITALLNILVLVFMLTQPTSLAFAGPMIIQTRLYSNSLLASLNLRNVRIQAYEKALHKPVELPTRLIVFAPHLVNGRIMK